MHLIKCDNGHIYDNDKFRGCPHCSSIAWNTDSVAEDLVSDQTDVDTEIPDSEEQQHYEQLTKRKTVAMLICVKGELFGDGFPIYEGENVIGRASNMDITIKHDITVKRNGHGTILYDDESGYKICNYSENGIYVNDAIIKDSIELKDRDVIRIGENSFVLVGADDVWKE